MCPSDLYIDIGNTAIKWCLLDDDIRSVLINDFSLDLLPKTPKVWVSCVANCGLLKGLKNTNFVQVQSSFKALKCGYKNPAELGVDRWLAMIAATDIYPNQNLLLIDAGSAITFDLVLNNTHKSGLIMPGLHALSKSFPLFNSYFDSCKHSLLVNTTDNSKDAWGFGVFQMFFSAIKQQIETHLQAHPDLTLIVSGGDANWIVEKIQYKVKLHNNLVLTGLSKLAASRKNQHLKVL